MASAVTTLHRRVSIASSLGNAVISLHLASTASCPKYQPLLLGPGADQMQRGALLRTVVRTAPCFPIHRKYALAAFDKLPLKPTNHCAGSDRGKQFQESGESKGIAAWDAVSRFQ